MSTVQLQGLEACCDSSHIAAAICCPPEGGTKREDTVDCAHHLCIFLWKLTGQDASWDASSSS